MRDLDAILDAVRPRLEELETRRRAFRERRRTAWLRIGKVCGAILLAAVPLGLLTRGGPLTLAPAIVALIVGVIMALVTVAGPSSEFKREFKSGLIGSLLSVMEPQVGFSPQGGVSEADFVRSGLFPTRPDRYRVEDQLQGKVGETSVRISEVHAEQKQTRVNSKGRTETHWVTIFQGLLMVADFHKHFRGTTRVLPDTAEKLLGGLGKLLQDFRPFGSEDLVYLEDPEFEKEFVVYGSDQVESRYVLSTAMLRRILDLKRKWKAEVRVSFVDSLVFLAVSERGDLFEPRLDRGAASKEQLAPLVSQLTLCLDLVNDLSLNTRIWSKA